jgi:glyoxylase I family protein
MTNHLAIPVKNLEESKKFYQKLGFKLFNSWEKPKQKLEAYWMQDKSGYKIELIYHPSNKNLNFPKTTEVQHLGIAVSNLKEKIKKLQKERVKMIVPTTKGITVKRFAFIKDPNGFSIELVEY